MSAPQFKTSQEAQAAFYTAFVKRDLNAMMAVWAEDDSIACVHPLSVLIVGRQAVRESWESIFRNSPEMQFMINESSQTANDGLAIHVVEEHIRAPNTPPSAPVYATNVYRLTDNGWRMVLHHASPASSPMKQEKQTLH